MIGNLIKSAIRHLRRHFGYSILNILGLSLGISSALFLIIYIADEISYDRYNEKASRIYRVSVRLIEPDAQFTLNRTMTPLGPQVVKDYPEIQSFVRFTEMPGGTYNYENIKYNEQHFVYADSTLFDIFTFKIIKGDVKSALREPGKIVLTETTAAKYFGRTDPIGKILTSGTSAYEVAGVIKDIPFNSHYRFDAIASWRNLPGDFGGWYGVNAFTYFLFPEKFNAGAFEIKMQEMFERYIKPGLGQHNLKMEFILEPVTRIHLYSTNPSEPEPTGSITYVYIFSLVALFLVLIASMNYINLATARSTKRAREVGLRKVAGSRQRPLILQFLSESLIFTVISVLISMAVLIILLPKFNLLTSKSFDLNVIYSPAVLLSLPGIILLVGVVGGSYPAFYLSRFTPVEVLKGEITQGSTGSKLRKTLAVIQYAVSMSMIICTLVIFRQLTYLQSMDQGFDQENVVSIRLEKDMIHKYPVLKQLLLDNPDIINVTSTDTPIGEGSDKSWFNVETDQGMPQKIVDFAIVDHDFIKTLAIKIIKGRNFQQDMPSDTLNAIIVNETFVNRMGWTEAIGKKVETGNFNGINARVIGVVNDYHQKGMYNDIESLVLIYRVMSNVIYIKLGVKNTRTTLTYIESKWKEVFPGQPYNCTFLKERFKTQFAADERRGLIFTIFTVLAIVIACLGLFGLVSYMVEQRTREIGIRKVFGCDEGKIMWLIIRDFLLLVSIGIIIAAPVAYYFMNHWLQKYVYRITIGLPLILTAALLTILITLITISFKAYQAAVIDPAVSVRTSQ